VAVAVSFLGRAVRLFGHAQVLVVYGHFLPGFAVVALAAVVLVLAVRDHVHADLVVVLDLARCAHDVADAAGRPLHRTVLDCRAAHVVGDLHLGRSAVQARARALVVGAVVDGLDAHVRVVLRSELAVQAGQAVAVAVLGVAVRDGRHALAFGGQHLARGTLAALAAVALAALVGAHGRARD